VTRGKRTLLLLVAAALLPSLAWASGASEVFTRTSLALILMITLADACGFLFERLGLPELVGEISAGILLGNLALLGIDFNFTALLRDSEFMTYSSELALVLLLFLVGVDSDMKELLKVGRNAATVAFAGVALPVLLGLGTATALGISGGIQGWFVGAMLAATSVGITAKLLEAQGKLKSPSGEVILGAAVIDDVLGILLLAVLASVAASGEFQWSALVIIVAKALLFFGGALFIGQRLMPHMVHMVAITKHASIWTGFAFCLALGFAELAALDWRICRGIAAGRCLFSGRRYFAKAYSGRTDPPNQRYSDQYLFCGCWCPGAIGGFSRQCNSAHDCSADAGGNRFKNNRGLYGEGARV